MKIIVTGGAGFIGSHIVDKCIDEGHQVVVIDNLSSGKKEHVNSNATLYNIDIRSDELNIIFEKEKPEVVIHQAAQIHVNTSVNDPMLDASINIIGSINLLEACRKNDVKKMVYASTAAVYGEPQYLPIDETHRIHPLSGYGCSKYSVEKYIEMYFDLYGLKYTILRYANVYGERQDPRGEGGVISIFVNQALEKKPLTIFGDGEQTRDYIYVEDVAKANVKAITEGENEIINIGTGVYCSLNDVAQLFSTFSGGKNKVHYGPERLGDIKHSYFDVKYAVDTLSFTPEAPFEEGLRRTYAYYDEEYRRMNKD